MARADSYYTDLGIVYYKDINPSGKTYTDKMGQSVDCETLTSSFTEMTGTQAVKTATHPVGVPAAHSYWVYAAMDIAATITVRLVSQYGNDAGSAPAVDSGWARVQLMNQDDGTIGNEIVLSTTGYYLLQTSSEHTTGRSRWEAKLTGSGDSGIVRIAGRAV